MAETVDSTGTVVGVANGVKDRVKEQVDLARASAEAKAAYLDLKARMAALKAQVLTYSTNKKIEVEEEKARAKYVQGQVDLAAKKRELADDEAKKRWLAAKAGGYVKAG